MKPETLLNSLDYVGEDLLAAAEQTVHARKHRPWAGVVAAAAVLLMAVGVGGFMLWQNWPGRTGPQAESGPSADATEPGEPVPSNTLPLLTVGDGSGLLFTEQFDDLAGQLQYDCWTGNNEILTLPVYRNETAAEGEPYGLPHWYSEAQLQTLLNEAAARLGATCTGEVFYETDTEDSQDQRPYSIHAATDLGELTVYGDGRVLLLFNGDHVVHARGEVEFDMPAGTTEEELWQAECAWAMSDCVAQLQPRLGLPECGVLPWTRWSYTYSGYHAWTLYPRRNDAAQQLLSRCFERVQLLTMDGHAVYGVEFAWAPAPDTAAAEGCAVPECLTLLGQYPIITLDEAKAELAAGNYLLPATEGEPQRGPDKGDAYAAVELIYPMESRLRTLMPYYRFWYAQENGLYAAVYVPAVGAEYLTDWETSLQAADPVETTEPEPPLTTGCFTLCEDAERSYFTDGATEVWMENDAVWVRELTTDETRFLLELKTVEGTETELIGVTAQRLYFGWCYTGDWWGRNVYSVDRQGQSTVELGDGQGVRFEGGWLFLESFRTDVRAFTLRVIDRYDRTVVDVKECWDYVLLDGSCYFIYAAGMQDPEALDALPEAERREALEHMRYDLCRLDPDGTVTVLGSLERSYYAAYFQFDPTNRQIRCYEGTEGGETLDLYTLRPVGETPDGPDETGTEPTETTPEPTEAPDGYIPRPVRQSDGSWAIAGTWGEVIPAQQYQGDTCLDPVWVDLDGDGFRELLYWCYGPTSGVCSVALCAYDLENGLPVLLDSQVYTLTWNVRPGLEAEGKNVWLCLEGVVAASAPEPASDSLIMTYEKAALPVRLVKGKLALDGADWLSGVTPLDPALEEAGIVGIGVSFDQLKEQVKDRLVLNHWAALVWAEPTDSWEGAAQTVYAAVKRNDTVTGLILYRKEERDSRWSFAAQGITPIAAPEDPAALEGLTVEQLTARFGPCHFDLGSGFYIPCWFTTDGRLLRVWAGDTVQHADLAALTALN